MENVPIGMSQKSPYSTNTVFSMHRVIYAKTIKSVVAETPDNMKEKQFYGSKNRDASAIIQRRAISSIGSSQNVSFQGAKNINDVRQARQRVRNSGSSGIPKKKQQKVFQN